MFAINQIKTICKYLNKIRKVNYATEIKYQCPVYKLHNLQTGPSATATVTKPEALQYYELMRTIRLLETQCNALYKARLVRGFCHLYSGQEAVGVGVKAALRDNDNVITSYRGHGWCYLLSKSREPLLEIFGELLGKESGCARGKGGSMHMYGQHFYGGNAIVGAQVPLGVGIAYASMYKKLDEVCVSIYGDGAANNGQVYEAYNMAKLWNVPCIFLCENNVYAMGTSVQRASSNHEFYAKGDTVPGIQVNGMDILAVREASKFARNHCSAGKGPILLETLTYRYSGHSLSDPGTTYRTHQEVKEMREKHDPIMHFKRLILNEKLCTDGELTAIDKKIKAAIKKATDQGVADHEPTAEELCYDIYANEVISEVRNCSPFLPNYKHKSLNIFKDKVDNTVEKKLK